MTGYREVVDRWIAMWNETDSDARRKTVDELFTPDAVYIFFNLEPRLGRAAIFRQVTVAHRIYVPRGFRFVSQNNARGHHDLIRFGWSMVDAATGETDMLGNDVLVLREGRIAADYQFHDLLSSVSYRELPPFDEFAPDLVPDLGTDDLAMYRTAFDRLRFNTPTRA